VEAAEAILGPYAGVVVRDGCTAYRALEKERRHAPGGPAPSVLAHCWSHVRRKFIEAELHDKRATEALDLIGTLFALEAEAEETAGTDLRARRLELRSTRSREAIDEFRRWMLAQRALPRSALGRAISYADGMWAGLCRFLEDGDVPMHNNASERALRGIAIGRTNHYGSRSRCRTISWRSNFSTPPFACVCRNSDNSAGRALTFIADADENRMDEGVTTYRRGRDFRQSRKSADAFFSRVRSIEDPDRR
jgi:hypothetical protein